MSRPLRILLVAALVAAPLALLVAPGIADAQGGDPKATVAPAPAPFGEPADARDVTLAPDALSPSQGGHLTTGDPPSPVVYPKQRIGITFHHRAHVLGVGESCESCHPGARTSESTKDLLVPTKGKCMECHKTDVVPWEWGKSVKDPAIDMPGANLRFSHALHLKQDGIKCMSCHAGVDEVATATVQNLPRMEACIACHVEKGAPTTCRTCHVSGRSGTIRTAYASGKLLPDDHGIQFMGRHGMQARRDLGYCASCHAQEDCLSCHDGAVPPTFHASSYLQMHPQDALANSPQCASCHRVERFCRDCHFRAQVTLTNPLGYGNGSFHGADWLNVDTPDFHGNVGRKNLTACAGCHVKEDCLSCHVYFQGAPRIHPPGWAGSTRMRRLAEANVSMCMSCHGQGEPGDPFPGP